MDFLCKPLIYNNGRLYLMCIRTNIYIRIYIMLRTTHHYIVYIIITVCTRHVFINDFDTSLSCLFLKNNTFLYIFFFYYSTRAIFKITTCQNTRAIYVHISTTPYRTIAKLFLFPPLPQTFYTQQTYFISNVLYLFHYCRQIIVRVL